MSHVANLTPRSPSGTSRKERAQRGSLKASNQVEVHPPKELAEPGRPTTTSREDDPHARGNGNHHPQNDATEKQKCRAGSNRTRRQWHVLIVGTISSPVD
jgi:hypothetical protein